ncbi:MAG: helix-turn-helix transcriptional regulator [Yoonia sp.]|nr:helix-turn-helix transcriptional regulator [Yoonia sp.]
MIQQLTKLARADLFRDRLVAAIALANSNQSKLARDTGVDRSTLSQLLRDDGGRLPNAHLVASCAAALGVSTDWLLGLSDRPEQAADLVAAAISMTEAPRALIDDHIFDWHQEAAGYKIRHVPAALPDMLKTADMLRWEYAPSIGKTIDQAVGASRDRLAWMRGSTSDYEISFSICEITSFARAEGYYADVPPDVRRAQLMHLRDLSAQLYPRLRLHLFDRRRLFSAPVTVFGPLLAVIYLGQNYLVFRDCDRVAALTDHFDALVCAGTHSSRDVTGVFDRLLSEQP